jgi:hypothetical protein
LFKKLCDVVGHRGEARGFSKGGTRPMLDP